LFANNVDRNDIMNARMLLETHDLIVTLKDPTTMRGRPRWLSYARSTQAYDAAMKERGSGDTECSATRAFGRSV
jgi:hypothetical protein